MLLYYLHRVVSKPANDLICLDLGHKAVGSEMPQPRIMIPGIDDFTIISHNEEHMVIRTSHAGYPEYGRSAVCHPMAYLPDC